MPLTFAETPMYYKDSQGQYQRILSGADMTGYRTAAAQDAVEVDYRADTKLYIDNIHTPTDDDMTADAQIASGKYFLIGGNLYKATTVIPAGDTIRTGTNCIKTNLAEALNALNT